MRTIILKNYLLGMFLLALFLLVILAGFEILPETSGQDDLVIEQQAGLQVTRGEFVAKEVLLLHDQSNPSQAIGNLQAVLPQFQQVQIGLLEGNPVYGLPNNPPTNVKSALSQGQGDYTQMVAALNKLLANPDAKPDPVQVAIILAREPTYTATMYQVEILLQQDAEARRLQILLIKLALITAIALAVIVKYLLFTRAALEKAAKSDHYPIPIQQEEEETHQRDVE